MSRQLFDEDLYQNLLLSFEDADSGALVEIFTTDDDEYYVDENRHLKPVLKHVIELLLPKNCDQQIRILLRQCVTAGGPYLYKQKSKRYGAFFVNLNIADSCLWCQNVFQFAHEFCHVLCYASGGGGGGDDDNSGKNVVDCKEIRYKHPNQWFEEAVCHAAALHALLKFDATLARRLYSREHAGVFAQYAGSVANCRLKSDETLPTWYATHRQQLREEQPHTLRARLLQSVVSLWLLDNIGMPLLTPTLRYLNQEGRAALLSQQQQQISFKRYLSRWIKAAGTDKQNRKTIRKIYRAFSTTLS